MPKEGNQTIKGKKEIDYKEKKSDTDNKKEGKQTIKQTKKIGNRQ